MPITKSRIASAPVYAVLPAHDIARAKDYYERMVGLETEAVPGAPDYLIVHAGHDTQFLLYKTTLTNPATAASFMVDDIIAAVRELRDRGVKFEEYDMPGLKTMNGIADMGPAGRSAWFMDSEGNALSIAEM